LCLPSAGGAGLKGGKGLILCDWCSDLLEKCKCPHGQIRELEKQLVEKDRRIQEQEQKILEEIYTTGKMEEVLKESRNFLKGCSGSVRLVLAIDEALKPDSPSA